MEITAKFMPVFTCRCCGVQEEGSRSSSVMVHSIEALQEALKHLSPHDMPYGWHANGRDRNGLMTDCRVCGPVNARRIAAEIEAESAKKVAAYRAEMGLPPL